MLIQRPTTFLLLQSTYFCIELDEYLFESLMAFTYNIEENLSILVCGKNVYIYI